WLGAEPGVIGYFSFTAVISLTYASAILSISAFCASVSFNAGSFRPWRWMVPARSGVPMPIPMPIPPRGGPAPGPPPGACAESMPDTISITPVAAASRPPFIMRFIAIPRVSGLDGVSLEPALCTNYGGEPDLTRAPSSPPDCPTGAPVAGQLDLQ